MSSASELRAHAHECASATIRVRRFVDELTQRPINRETYEALRAFLATDAQRALASYEAILQMPTDLLEREISRVCQQILDEQLGA